MLISIQLMRITSDLSHQRFTMVISDNIRKCVVFLGYRMANGEERLAGSAFFLGSDNGNGLVSDIYLVTAKHVIDKICKLGIEFICIRMNLIRGEAIWITCNSFDWRFHPTDPNIDVAVLRIGMAPVWDHLVIPLSMCVTPQILKDNEIGLGDEVFIVGLFHHHHGARKNIPIVRIGNLAALAEEKISTKEFGLIDAYLIEARSIGGLSGSPVFLNPGVARLLNNQVKHATSQIFFLLGLVHGHYDVPSGNLDHSNQHSDNKLSTEKVNTGIAIVVTVEKIKEVFDAYSQ